MKNFYIQSALLNGETYLKSFFLHKQIENGSSLSFVMGATASSFGTTNLPATAIENDEIILNPIIEGGNQVSYSGSKTIHLSVNQPKVTIFYTSNGQDPNPGSAMMYKAPIEISNSVTIKAIAVDTRGYSSKVTTAKFHHRSNNYSVISLSKYEQQYSGGGPDALLDELEGSNKLEKSYTRATMV